MFLMIYPLVIQVGFEAAIYSVSEAEGFAELCVITADPVNRPFVLRAATVLGSKDRSACTYICLFQYH